MPLRREPLPNRRRCETFDMRWGNGRGLPHTITVGYYDDGRVGEVFINGGKSGELAEAIARDSAVILSLSLQHGVSVETIAHALTRDAKNVPQTIVGAVVDILGAASDGRGSEAQGIPAGSAQGGVDAGEADGS